MKTTLVVHPNYKNQEDTLSAFIKNFETEGEDFGNQDRNAIKLFKLSAITVNIKSFKVPNIINQIAYKFLRKSKAQRSFEYANMLIKKGIGTPQPIAYYEFTTPLLFKNSYYISEHQMCDITYRELTTDLNYPNHEVILRAFTRFTFKLHELGIHFLDHSPGNTLIKQTEKDYEFYLVDLNRMEFRTLDFETRIKNFARLTTHKSMVEVMSDEYAICTNKSYDEVFNLMWQFTVAFQEQYYKKIRLKKRVFFWKKKYRNSVSKSPIQ
jgi:hypothetical protein